MTSFFDAIMVLLILTNLALLGTSRLRTCIHICALQGLLLGTLPLTTTIELISFRAFLLAGGGMVMKAIVFPRLLERTLQDTHVQREVEPFIGYSISLLAGIGLLGFSLWLGSRLPLPSMITSPLVIPVSFFMMMVGLLLIVSRKKALTQVLGYLVMENGIYAFGVAISPEAPFLVEMGMLLDAFVAVFIMGILMFHINREFDHIDTDRLSVLKD
ncbi:MAG: hydrogenase [Candidatus Omnitrophota bacterium]|jgi:hydrogenase-4 component E|nr:MAG: hydrogenase [Candidatus Omnitrophota bacterium]